jgi:hypothetical protein
MEVSDVKRLEAENVRLKCPLAESPLENEVTREALRKNGNCTGPSGHGAVDAGEGIVATPSARSSTDERDGAALSTPTGSQHRAAHIDRGACTASPSLRRWDDLPEAALAWRVRKLQAV